MTPAPEGTFALPEDFLIARELGWLEFDRRVLMQALDEASPLLERLRFLSIFTSNLDEFFMKRVGRLRRQTVGASSQRLPDDPSGPQVLAEFRKRLVPLLEERRRCFTESIKPALAAQSIFLLSWDELETAERDAATAYFRDHVFRMLTPLAVDPGHPFPFLSNLSLSIGVSLRHPDRDEKLFARVKVPPSLPQWFRLPGSKGYRFVSLADIIRNNLSDIFPGMVVRDMILFRVTRSADIPRDEAEAEDLIEMVADELRQRRAGQIVRLEEGRCDDPWLSNFLKEELELQPEDIYEMPLDVDFLSLSMISDLALPSLSYEPLVPTVPPELKDPEANMLGVVRGGDLLVHHPYESFSGTVERFVRQSVEDPKVIAIKMTLYRIGDNSPFVPLLIQAAESGKQVTCLVEVKAHMDEARNINLARALEKAGVHVVYGIVGYKTHAKMILVVREEADGLRCYGHIGTGNYHSSTSKTYTDLGLFTANREITDDIVDLFNYLTGRSLKREYRHLLVAPHCMKEKLLDYIRREIEHADAGRPAEIIAKCNNLQDPDIIHALCLASQSGVRVSLIVRGFCCLRPQVAGISESISVVSVIGRFLEHSRLFYFRAGAEEPADGSFYISSADWMWRNFHRRVEVAAPIFDKTLKERCWILLRVMLGDTRTAWDMQADGTYTQRIPSTVDADRGTHFTLMALNKR